MALNNNIDRSSVYEHILSKSYFQHHDRTTHKPVIHKYNVIGDRVEECRSIVVFTFEIGDVEDPDLYAATPLIEWENSEAGQWIMKHSVDVPVWSRIIDHSSYNHKYVIRAKLMGPSLTEWLLRKAR